MSNLGLKAEPEVALLTPPKLELAKLKKTNVRFAEDNAAAPTTDNNKTSQSRTGRLRKLSVTNIDSESSQPHITMSKRSGVQSSKRSNQRSSSRLDREKKKRQQEEEEANKKLEEEQEKKSESSTDSRGRKKFKMPLKYRRLTAAYLIEDLKFPIEYFTHDDKNRAIFYRDEAKKFGNPHSDPKMNPFERERSHSPTAQQERREEWEQWRATHWHSDLHCIRSIFNAIPQKVKDAQVPRQTYNHITIPKAPRFEYQKVKRTGEVQEPAEDGTDKADETAKPCVRASPSRSKSQSKKKQTYYDEKPYKDHLQYHLLHIKRLQEEQGKEQIIWDLDGSQRLGVLYREELNEYLNRKQEAELAAGKLRGLKKGPRQILKEAGLLHDFTKVDESGDAGEDTEADSTAKKTRSDTRTPDGKTEFRKRLEAIEREVAYKYARDRRIARIKKLEEDEMREIENPWQNMKVAATRTQPRASTAIRQRVGSVVIPQPNVNPAYRLDNQVLQRVESTQIYAQQFNMETINVPFTEQIVETDHDVYKKLLQQRSELQRRLAESNKNIIDKLCIDDQVAVLNQDLGGATNTRTRVNPLSHVGSPSSQLSNAPSAMSHNMMNRLSSPKLLNNDSGFQQESRASFQRRKGSAPGQRGQIVQPSVIRVDSILNENSRSDLAPLGLTITSPKQQQQQQRHSTIGGETTIQTTNATSRFHSRRLSAPTGPKRNRRHVSITDAQLRAANQQQSRNSYKVQLRTNLTGTRVGSRGGVPTSTISDDQFSKQKENNEQVEELLSKLTFKAPQQMPIHPYTLEQHSLLEQKTGDDTNLLGAIRLSQVLEPVLHTADGEPIEIPQLGGNKRSDEFVKFVERLGVQIVRKDEEPASALEVQAMGTQEGSNQSERGLQGFDMSEMRKGSVSAYPEDGLNLGVRMNPHGSAYESVNAPEAHLQETISNDNQIRILSFPASEREFMMQQQARYQVILLPASAPERVKILHSNDPTPAPATMSPGHVGETTGVSYIEVHDHLDPNGTQAAEDETKRELEESPEELEKTHQDNQLHEVDIEEREDLTPERQLDPTILSADDQDKSVSPPQKLDVTIDGMRVGKQEMMLTEEQEEVKSAKELEEIGNQGQVDFTSTMRMFSKGVEKLNSMMITSEHPVSKIESDCDAKSVKGPIRMLFQDGSQPNVKSDYLPIPGTDHGLSRQAGSRPQTAGGKQKVIALSNTGSTSKARLSLPGEVDRETGSLQQNKVNQNSRPIKGDPGRKGITLDDIVAEDQELNQLHSEMRHLTIENDGQPVSLLDTKIEMRVTTRQRLRHGPLLAMDADWPWPEDYQGHKIPGPTTKAPPSFYARRRHQGTSLRKTIEEQLMRPVQRSSSRPNLEITPHSGNVQRMFERPLSPSSAAERARSDHALKLASPRSDEYVQADGDGTMPMSPSGGFSETGMMASESHALDPANHSMKDTLKDLESKSSRATSVCRVYREAYIGRSKQIRNLETIQLATRQEDYNKKLQERMQKLAKLRPKPQSAMLRFNPASLIGTTERDKIALLRKQQPHVRLEKYLLASLDKNKKKNSRRRVLHNNDFDDLGIIEKLAQDPASTVARRSNADGTGSVRSVYSRRPGPTPPRTIPLSYMMSGEQSSAEREQEDVRQGPTLGQRQLERELQRIIATNPRSRATADKAGEAQDTLIAGGSGFADSIMMANNYVPQKAIDDLLDQAHRNEPSINIVSTRNQGSEERQQMSIELQVPSPAFNQRASDVNEEKDSILMYQSGKDISQPWAQSQTKLSQAKLN